MQSLALDCGYLLLVKQTIFLVCSLDYWYNDVLYRSFKLELFTLSWIRLFFFLHIIFYKLLFVQYFGDLKIALNSLGLISGMNIYSL